MATGTGTPTKKGKNKQPARELDTSNATKGVWLIKVPNYVSEMWKEAEPNSDLGLMRISSNPQKVEVSFTLSEELAKKGSEKVGMEMPRKHRVLLQDTSRQSLSTFSEESSTNQLTAEGRVTQKADLQPFDSASYMKLKQYQIKEAGKTKFQARQLDNAPRVIKPVSYHAELEKPKQVEKRAREDRELVLDLIFTAFQSHQYYTLKDLVHKTKQPTSYLKEILREVCTYNTRAPHKNMWELKPEFRHYSKKKGDSSSSTQEPQT